MKILIVDDEKNIRESLVKLLKLEGMEPVGVENGLAAQRILEKQVFDLALLDLKMPGLSGLELLEWIKTKGPELTCIMISAHGQVQDALAAMKLGARDYLTKPFEPEELVLRIKNALPLAKAEKEKDLVLPSSIEKLVEKVAKTNSTILITGESGTGKEITAKAIHHRSSQKEGPFLGINLGAIPENLLESELFGYEKGAFTGADKRKPGLMEMAKGGTLFLDEIGEMPMSLQVKILRALQDKSIRRLGGTQDIPVESRVICATNKDLKDLVQKGQFREDLFYRINVFPLHLSPLKDRLEDLPFLVKSLRRKFERTWKGPFPEVSQGALDRLKTYPFPGNIRELENILERASILCDGKLIVPEDLQFLLPGEVLPTPKTQLKSLKDWERAGIEQALLRWEGNQTKAAQELGITRRTLFSKIQEYHLENP